MLYTKHAIYLRVLLLLGLPIAFGLIFWSSLSSVQAQNVIPQQVITDEPTLPNPAFNYANIRLPAHFRGGGVRNLDNTPITNTVTNEGATLGRVLFYDTKMSIDDTVSCSSCHLQTNGFSDPDQFSTGVNGQTPRNSMGLANNLYYPNGKFFWDERAATLEHQVLLPIQDAVEMNLTLEALVAKLEATTYYPDLFEATFGDNEITSTRISLALAQFLRSMVSYQSRLDQALEADDELSLLTAEELQGRELFNGPPAGCSRCHRFEVQVAEVAFNNGLDATLTDLGVGGANGVSTDEGKFKVPSLRNIELTGPYMHDGRFDTLEEVVEFYNSEIQVSPNIDARLLRPNGDAVRMNLTDEDKAALVAYMKTFTDETFITDPKFSNPFATAQATETPTETPTNTPVPTDTPVPTNTPVPTSTPVPTNTPTPTPTNTSVPTDTPAPLPTDTSTPTNTPVPTNTPTLTNTPAPIDTPTPTLTQTPMPTATLTSAPTATGTSTVTSTVAATPVSTPTRRPTPTRPARPTPDAAAEPLTEPASDEVQPVFLPIVSR
ncbi:MAG: cytochrome c peroxidase [Chloroflexota bacterium]